METTANYGLKKLADGDPVDILEMSYNMEVIDVELKKKADSSGGSLSGMTVKTVDSTATKFPVPVAGESAKTFLGKVKKFLEDTKSWMNGVCLLGQLVNNCVTNNPNLPLAAAQGKVLMDLYTQLNSDLGGLKTYTSVLQLGLATETISDLSQIVAAMPNKSMLFCASDSQAPNIQFPSEYGTIEIKKVDSNRVSLKYYMSSSVANGKTYTGSYHSSNGFSGWFD